MCSAGCFSFLLVFKVDSEASPQAVIVCLPCWCCGSGTKVLKPIYAFYFFESELAMQLEVLHQFLLCSLAINYTILLIWFLLFFYARDKLRQLHTRWFALTATNFDAIHYAGMAGYKILILVFNLTPSLALYLMRT